MQVCWKFLEILCDIASALLWKREEDDEEADEVLLNCTVRWG